jgi:S-adenosyl-L-methionine hydrolase (adenosine-forming)
MRKPILTLTTDFGRKDHFAGVMKGVILGICPDADIVDISHDVQPFEISEGAYLIAQAYRFFPTRTVHVVVVDPGVGSARRPILVEADGQFFIGPDNGVLAMVYSKVAHKARVITNEKYFLHPVSRTFHGRDIFAPSGAHLAKDARPSTFGRLIEDHLKPAFTEPQRIAKRVWVGTVLHIDRFGNLITNFHIDSFSDVRVKPFELAIGTQILTRLGLTFAEIDPGEAFAIVGSSGYIEIAINQASAARALGCGVGAPCELTIA